MGRRAVFLTLALIFSLSQAVYPARIEITPASSATGTVTSVSGVTANGFSFSIANSTTTPAITLNSPFVGKNLIINGNFNVWQRGTSFVATGSGAYSTDKWQNGNNSDAVITIARDTSVPTLVSGSIPLSNYSAKITVTTADTSIAAGQILEFQTMIEGYDFLKIAQQPFVLTFYVKAHRTGTYCVSFRNNGSDRSYVAEYSVGVADTWEKKTVNVSASPSAGTWDYTTGQGVVVAWALAAGSTFQTTANAWNTGNFIATSNQINGVAATTDNFALSQVQVEYGSNATNFEVVPYWQDLHACRRFCRVASFFVPSTIAQNLSEIDMRVTPTITGGGTGFTSTGTTADSLIAFQTAGAAQTLTLTADY